MLRHRLPGLRPTAVLLACAMPSASIVASAATAHAAVITGSAEPEAAPQEDPLAAAQALYTKGRAAFDTADYRAAIDLWTEAYATVPDTTEGGQIKVLLIYNIATAREKAFEITEDPTELRQARILLKDFEKSIPALYGEGEEANAERARVQEKIAALDERIEELQAQEDHPQMPGDGIEPGDEPESEITDPVVDDPGTDPLAKPLIISGAAALTLGVGGLGLMGAGLAMGADSNDISDLEPDQIEERRDRFARGRTGNTLAIAGGAIGGVLVVAGGVLLALGLKRKKAGSSSVALVPHVGPQRAGIGLRGRF